MSSKQLRSTCFLMLLLLAIVTSIPTTAQGSTTVSVTFDVIPQTIVVNETPINVTIRLTGDTSACPVPPTAHPVDAVLVIDVSDSMREQDGLPESRLAYARQAAQLFVQTLALNVPVNQGGDQVGLVIFNDVATELLPLSQDRNQLISTIGGLTNNGGTDIGAGLEIGTNTVIDPLHQNTDAARVIVLLSDGDSDPDTVLLAAERARSAGAQVITIAVGTTANTTLLEQIADNPSDFYNEINAANLPAIFQRIANLIQIRTAARELQFTYSWNSSAFALVPGAVISPPPISVAPNAITWSLGELTNSDAAEFQFQMIGLGLVNQQNIGQLSGDYDLCETQPREAFSSTGPLVSVVQPTPTPTFTPTPTPLPTNTPQPTATPTQPSLTIGSFVPSPPTTPSLLTSLNFCDGSFSWLIPLVLLIIALVAAILWMLWHRKRHVEGKCSALCFVLWSIFGFYTTLALWLFLLPLTTAVCPTQESVYFWRQDPTTGYTGVYLSAPNASESASFNVLNEGRCVGCHTVSQSTNHIAAIGGAPPNKLLIYDFNGTAVNIPDIQAFFASFSPDGKRLVYTNADLDLHILDLTTGADTPLQGASEADQVETMPSWGPNGTIAFVRPVDPASAVAGYAINGECDIYTVPETGGAATPLLGASQDGFNYYPSYSPNGQWLSFTHHNNSTTYSDPEANIYIIPAEGGQPMAIAANRDDAGNEIPGAANSWSTWNRDSTQLAFNSQRSDPNYNIYITTINPDGTSTAAVPLASASQRGVFEHLPFWGMSATMVPWYEQMAGLWYFLLPIPLLALLAALKCRQGKIVPLPPLPKPIFMPPPPAPEPLRMPPLLPTWQPQPTLVIGLGESGRWVLTHLKKTLHDAGLGKVPAGIQLLALDIGNWSQMERQESPVQFAGVYLNENELVELKDNLAPDLRDLAAKEITDPQLRKWLNPQMLLGLGDERLDLHYGARGQRVLARFGLLRHLQTAPDDQNLFARLKTSVAAVLEAQKNMNGDQRLNIIVVADTFGDISSSGLFDAALLAREAGRKNNARGYRIVAHILTDQIRREVSQDNTRDQVNTGATLREIARFQLAKARPFPLRYKQIDGNCDYLPFDEFVIYDGTGQDLRQPQLSIYPAIADTIALGMDEVARQSTEMRGLQNDESTKISSAQAETDQVHVIGQGIYTYRLPFADIIEVILSRFQQEVFRAFIMGHDLSEAQIRLDERLNKENFGNNSKSTTANGVAHDFLTGKLSAVEVNTNVLKSMKVIDSLINPNPEISRLATVSEVEQDAFANLLPPLLSLLLNGQKVTIERDIFAARGGKIGFVLAFLNHLQLESKQAQAQIKQIGNNAADSIATALDNLIKVAKTAEESLTLQAQALGLLDGKDVTVSKRIMPRVTALDQRRKEMDSISTVRTYLWRDPNNKPLEEVWYQQYLVPVADSGQVQMPNMDKRQAALKQFYWDVKRDENNQAIRVQLNLVGEENVTLEDAPDSVIRFDTALSDLASRYCMPIINEQTLARTLTDTLLNEDHLRDTIQTLIEKSRAQIAVSQEYLHHALSNVIIAANETVDLRELQQEVSHDLGTPDGQGYLRLNVTDPYSVSVNRRLAAVPLNDISSLENAQRTYRQNHNLSDVANARLNPNTIPTAVYESEAIALELESLYRETLNERPLLLHPVIATAFTDENRTRAFYLALAAGNLETRKVRGETRYALYYTGIEGRKEFPSSSMPGEHPLIAGLMTVLLNHDLFPAQMIEMMVNRYRTDEDVVVAFNEWLTGEWKLWVEELEGYDERSKAIVMDILRVSRLYAYRYRE